MALEAMGTAHRLDCRSGRSSFSLSTQCATNQYELDGYLRNIVRALRNPNSGSRPGQKINPLACGEEVVLGDIEKRLRKTWLACGFVIPLPPLDCTLHIFSIR